ncbi:MAG: GrpB family protein [Polyangiaceae bacterium]|nr:GrpB family protein [Polyangiaceae bacterium]
MPASSVELLEYNPAYPERFEFERILLTRALGPWRSGPIEHVGSTAVPGLISTPIVDIMVGVESLQASRPAVRTAAQLGYCFFPYRAEEMHWFCKPTFEVRSHQLYLVPVGGRVWQEQIALRDELRKNQELATEYAALKRQLAATFPNDQEAYTEGKEPFVKGLMSRLLGPAAVGTVSG